MNVAQPLVQASLLGEAIDAGPALVFVADEHMRYVAVNETACATLGYSREELLGMCVSDVAASDDSSEQYARMIAEGALAGRTTLRRKDGTTLEIEYRAAEVTVAQLTFYVAITFAVD